MNWELALNIILAFGLLFVIFLTLGFYISYRQDKRITYPAHDNHPTRGRYFTRHIPESLASVYEEKITVAEAYSQTLYKKNQKMKGFYLIPLMLIAIIFLIFLTQHFDRF